MSSSFDYLDLCRLCLVKDRVTVPIFEAEGDVRQIFLKITACLPVKVSRDDKLPKKICDDCVYKVETFYQFWNTTANAEKQLLQWLCEVGGLEDKQGYEVLDSNVMKQEQGTDSRLDGNVMQVGGHQNNMDMGMMDNMSLITMSTGSEQQFTSVPMDASGTVQAVPGPSTQTHEVAQSQTGVSHIVEEEEESEEDENSDEGCDNEEGLPVKEETEEGQSDQTLEPTQFVSLPCDEAGPSGLQQQKMAEMSEMTMQQTADGDPKTGKNLSRWGRKQSIISRIRVRMTSELTDSDSLKEEQPKSSSKAMPKKPVKPTSKRKRSVPSKISKDSATAEKKKDASSAGPPAKSSKLEKSVPQPEETQEKPVEVKQEPAEPLLYKKLKGGRFGCKVCHETFSHRYKVKHHIKMKHAPREIFQCADCSKAFKSKYQLNMHSNQHRENSSDYLFCCDKCDYRAKSKYYLKTHEIRKHTNEYNYECDHCNKRFKMKMDLKFHLGTHSASEHMCDACGRMYTSQDSLHKHRRVVHVNDYKFQCEICHQKLLTQENLNSHMQSHKNLHKCDECGLKFTRRYYVTRHKKRVHKVEKTNLCPVCGKAFVCMATLRVHYLTHAKVKPYMCNVCGFSFTQRSSMMLHWKRKHPDAEDPPPPVILTNFFDAIQSEVNKLVQTEPHQPATTTTAV